MLAHEVEIGVGRDAARLVSPTGASSRLTPGTLDASRVTDRPANVSAC
ncbi:hypothetical protein GGR73_002594 [Xanthomonas sp. F14]